MQIGYSLLISTSLLAVSTAQAETSVDLSGLLESVIVTANRSVPTSLPAQIATTLESATREQVAQTVNATDSEDALKYFPSLLVRKRYIGDYNHAVLSSRASGTGNSARSAVYADGVLLSNYLGNGAAYAPRWMLVTPEEIERVDVMYGPFSAAYPGNSVGAIVDYVTRMPSKLEAHVKAAYVVQPFALYNTDDTYTAHQESASFGDRFGDFSFWLNFNHLNSHGQPQTFPTKAITTTTQAALPTDPVVTGAVSGMDRFNIPWLIIGTATEYTTLQDHAKLKLAYEITPTLRASYLFGYWTNDAEGRPVSYLRDAAGNTLQSGANLNLNGYRFTVNASDFSVTNDNLVHVMHGLSLKSNTLGTLDYEVAASRYDYARDQSRTPTAGVGGLAGGAGTLTDQNGTGWSTLALRGTWRPQGIKGAHILDFGYQFDHYKLRILRSNVSNWLSGAATGVITDVGGKTKLHSVYAQDVWAFASQWKAVLGARVEQWQATDGFTQSSALPAPMFYASRKQSYVSPKVALAYEATDSTALKLSVGRAVRMPTVNEVYGATTTANQQFINDPNLKPEKSWTAELSIEQDLNAVQLRITGFYEVAKESLFSDRRVLGSTVTTRVVNVGKIATPGVELSLLSGNLWVRGLDVSGSITWADSRIKENAGYVNAQGELSDATLGKYQPRVPEWRATALLNYRITSALNVAYGARYSGEQYTTLDNSDSNGFAYQGSSRYFTTDVRVRWQFLPQWTAALGVDNLNNYKYWNFHPYPQRSYAAELQWDL